MNNVIKHPTIAFRPSSKHPIRFDKLHPGSTFRIVKEPSRGLMHSRDNRVYRKAYDGFYAEDIYNKKGCCLMPHDMVMPVVKDKGEGRLPVPAQQPRAEDVKQLAAVGVG